MKGRRKSKECPEGDRPLTPGKQLRPHFPLFARNLKSPPAYLDSAASSQKPSVVIDTFSQYLSFEHANIHRGAYQLSANATERYDEAREKVAEFIGASSSDSIVFTSGATGSINLVARSYGDLLNEGDAVLISHLEHHSNFVPWQMLAKRNRLQLEFIDIHENAELNMESFYQKLKEVKPKLVAVTALSNAFGSVVPIKQIIDSAHEIGAKVLIDAAQAVAHMPMNVSELEPDFVAFSAHKMYGPTGVGALYAKPELLEEMDPFLGGGDMIERVSVEGSTWAAGPRKFEAGTPPIAEAIAFGVAIDFLNAIGIERIEAFEEQLFEKLFEQFQSEPGVTVYGPATTGGKQASILSFNVENVHPHDLGTIADSYNVQLRAGHHCAMPAMKRLGIPSTARVSLGVHSDEDDIEAALVAIRAARKMFA